MGFALQGSFSVLLQFPLLVFEMDSSVAFGAASNQEEKGLIDAQGPLHQSYPMVVEYGQIVD